MHLNLEPAGTRHLLVKLEEGPSFHRTFLPIFHKTKNFISCQLARIFYDAHCYHIVTTSVQLFLDVAFYKDLAVHTAFEEQAQTSYILGSRGG